MERAQPRIALADALEREVLTRERDEALLLTCTDGTQAAFAAATLRQIGYVHVAWLQGGTRAWQGSGRALETSPPPSGDDASLPPARGDMTPFSR